MKDHCPPRLTNVALTCSNDRFIDGAGAQLHRIYSIYALSRFLDISYVHSPIKELGYYGLSALEKNETFPEIVTRYNKIFSIPSDVTVPPTFFLYDFVRTDLDFLCNLKNAVKGNSEFHLVRIVFSERLIEASPQALRYITSISPFENLISPLFRLAIHVRRGDLFLTHPERILPNSYYLSVVMQIIEVLRQLDISFVCELYTELPSKKFFVTPEQKGLQDFPSIPGQPRQNRIKAPIEVNPEQNYIEEFEILPNLKKFINTDPIETMKSLATADLVVISRSSFSYLSALLNKKGIIVYHPSWNPSPASWIDGTQEASLFRSQLLKSCETWKNRTLIKQ